MGDVQEQFEQMMLALQSPNEELRKHAEATYLHTKGTNGMWLFQALVELAGSSKNELAQKIALVELRKILLHPDFSFKLYTPEAINYIKERQLVVMANTNDPTIRGLSAECITWMVRKLYMDNGPGWADLWPLLMQTMANPAATPGARAGCATVFETLPAELIDSCLQSHHRTLAGAFTQCVSSGDVGLAVTTAKALGGFLKATAKKDAARYSATIPPILHLLAKSLNESRYDVAKDVSMYICDLVDAAPEAFRHHTTDLLQGMMQVASTPAVQKETRHMAIEVMLTYCESEPKTIRKVAGFAKALFDLLFSYLLNPEFESDWENTPDSSEEGDLEKSSDFDIGATGIDRLASSLKARHVQQIASQAIVQNIQHSDWRHRNAAVTAVTYIVEACADEFQPQLGVILNYVYPLLKDPSVYTRHAACLCLAQCCSDFPPQYQQQHYQHVLPAFLACLADKPRIQSLAASGINTFFDEASCGEDAKDDALAKVFTEGYADALFGALVPLMNSSPYLFVKKECCEAIGSIAEFCKNYMNNYVPLLVPEFQKVLAIDETQFPDPKEVVGLKCAALQSLTLLAAAVKLPAFTAFARPVCDFLVNLLNYNFPVTDPRSPYILRAWTCMAECMGAEIAPYLPVVMPRMIQGAGAACDYEYVLDTPGESLPDAPEGCIHARINTPDKGEVVVKLKTAEVDEKSLALSVLRVMMDELEETNVLAPYLDDIARVGMQCLSFKTLEEVRASACYVIQNAIKAYKKCNPQAIPAVINHVEEQLIELIINEPSIEVVTEFWNTMKVLLMAGDVGVLDATKAGRAAEVLLEIIKASLKRRTEVADERQELGEEDEEDHEALDEEDATEDALLEACCEAAGAFLLKVPSFVPLFVKDYLPHVRTLLTPSMTQAEQKAGLHLLCKFLEGRSQAALALLRDISAPLFAYITSDDADLLQCAFYGLGVMLEVTNPPVPGFDVAGFTSTLRESVAFFLSSPKAADPEFEHCKTNVIHVAIKLLEHSPAGTYDPAMIWTAIVNGLPGSGDEEEAQAMHEKLLRWIAGGNPLTADPRLQQAIIAKLKTADKDCLNEATKKELEKYP